MNVLFFCFIAEKLFEWAQNINYRVNELWLKIERITSLNDQVVQGINPSIITELEEVGQEVKVYIHRD